MDTKSTDDVLDYLAEEIAKKKNIKIKEVDLDKPFFEYGFDSKSAVLFSGKVQKKLNLDLEPTVLIDYPTLRKLAVYLESLMRESKERNFEKYTDKNWSDRINTPVSIIGMACNFPGASDVQKFYENLWNGKCSVSGISEERVAMVYSDWDKEHLKKKIFQGGYLDGIDKFDYCYFGLSKNEADCMDPQQRMLMQEVVHAIEDCYMTLEEIKSKRTGIFIGASNFDYIRTVIGDKSDMNAVLGNASCMLANRISYLLDLQGPSMTIDTACSSSLIAVYEAVESIRRGECDIAIAAGVNLLLDLHMNEILADANMLSKDGFCYTFDERANGYVRGEGVGVLILRAEQEAVKEGNRVYASILGGALNQDGRSASLTAPNKIMQVKLLKEACKNAGVRPEEIQYIETHGTGTALGDSIEISAITEARRQTEQEINKLYVGSVKSNIGHLESAAGIAGIIKAAICIYNGFLVRNVNFQVPNPKIDFNLKNIQVLSDNTEWKEKRKLCGVSSFGFGGANCHIILQNGEKSENEEESGQDNKPFYMIPVSAVSEESLKKQVQNIKDWILNENHSLSDLERMLVYRRSSYLYRVCYVVANKEELAKEIEETCKNGFSIEKAENNKIAFLFSGQGTQWISMARNLEYFEIYQKTFETCRNEFLNLDHCDIQMVLETKDNKIMDSTYFVQPLLFSIQVSVFEVLKALGCNFSSTFGHSLGEIAAAYASGALSLRQAALIIHFRSTILERFTGKGKMLSVEINEEKAQNYIEKYKNLSVAVINEENSVVISGITEEIENLKNELDSVQIKNRYLPVNYAFHFKGLEPFKEELIQSLGKVQYRPSRIHFMSTVTGSYLKNRQLDAEYWAKNMRNTVRFHDAAQKITEDHNVIVEIAPSSALAPYLLSEGKEGLKVISVQRRRTEPLKMFLKSVAELYKIGSHVNWDIFIKKEGKNIPIPKYHFEKQSCWFESNKHVLPLNIGVEKYPVMSKEMIMESLLGILENNISANVDINKNTKLSELPIDSLHYFQMKGNIEKTFCVKINLSVLISGISMKDLAAHIFGLMSEKNQEVADHGKSELSHLVTDGQKAIIIDQLYHPESSMYNMQGCWKLSGDIDIALWKEAFDRAVNRHVALKLLYVKKDDDICQFVREDRIELLIEKISDQTDVKDFLEKECNEVFDLSRNVIKGRIYCGKQETHYFLLSIHHCAIDGISIYLLLKEIIEIYHLLSQKKDYKKLEDTRYFHYQEKEWKFKKSQQYQDNILYWKEELAFSHYAGRFPVGTVEKPEGNSESEEISFPIKGEIFKKLHSMAKVKQVSPFTILYAVYQIMYYKMTGEEDFVTCTYSAGRSEEALFDVIGYMVKVVMSRNRMNGKLSVSNYISNLYNKLLTAYDKCDISMQDLCKCMSDNSFNVPNHVFVYEKILENNQSSLFVYDNENEEKIFDGIKFQMIQTKLQYSQYDMVFMAEECENYFMLKLQYKNKEYRKKDVENLLHVYLVLLEQIVKDSSLSVEEYRMVNEEEQRVLEKRLCGGKFHTSQHGMLFHQCLEKFAITGKNNIAIRDRDTSITYGEWNERSNYVAREILKYIDGKNEPVVICMDKSIDFLIAVFAVLKAGCSYIPIDCRYPVQRIQYILKNSKAKYAFLDSFGKKTGIDTGNIKVFDIDLMKEGNSDNLNLSISLDDVAYIIYTSGSTGKPKGVMVTHRGVGNVIYEQEKLFHVKTKDRVSFFASISFDASVFDILMAVGHGAQLCFDSYEKMGSGEQMRKFLMNYQISVTTLPSSVLESMEDEGLQQLRVIVTAGEPCSKKVKDKWVLNHKFFNAYGVTEATIWNTTSECQWNEPVYIGNCVNNHQLYILNHEKNICPVGVAGEMYISSSGLAKGYIGLGQMNRERFIKLFDQTETYYRTGDLVRLEWDQGLEYIGRCDNQVKIRGFRIELEEVEKVIQQQEKVISSIVVVNKDTAGDRLLAFVKLKENSEGKTIAEIKNYLETFLPYYMVPESIIAVKEWIVTSNGKIDRKAMLDEYKKDFQERKIKEGKDKTEIFLVDLIKGILKEDALSVSDRILQIGINSISAYEIIGKVKENYGVSLTFRDIMKNPSIEELADLVRKQCQKDERNREKPITEKIVLSEKQKGIWLSAIIRQNSSEYNIPVVLKVKGELNLEFCIQAFEAIINKHNIMRTRYYQEDGQIFGIIENSKTETIIFEDISEIPGSEKEDYLNRAIEEMKNIEFDLRRLPLYRFKIIKTENSLFYFLFTIHHMIADGWSVNLIMEEFRKNYQVLENNKEIIPELLNKQYEDVSFSWMEAKKSPEFLKKEEYWKKKLEEQNYQLCLPEAYQRPSNMTHRGDSITLILNEDLSETIKQYAKNNQMTLFSYMLSVCSVMLSCYSNQKEIILGVPNIGRESTDEQKIIGMFLDTLIVKIRVDEKENRKAFEQKVSEEIIETYENKEVGLDRIIELVNPERNLSTTPLFQVMFNMINFDLNISNIGSLELEVIKREEQKAKYDLTFYISENNGNLQIRLNYYSDVFAKEDMKRMLENYRNLLEEVSNSNIKDMSDYIKIASENDEQETEKELTYLSNENLLHGYDQSLKRCKENIAVSYRGRNFSYQNLEENRMEVEKKLCDLGVGVGDCVAVVTGRYPFFLPVLLAVCKRGASFLLIDKEWPAERKNKMIAVGECGFQIVVGEDGSIEYKHLNSRIKKRILDCSYRSVTSGTTGIPKCVLGHNSAVNHFVDWEVKNFRLCEEDRVSVLSGISHDPLLRDIFVPFYAGARMVFPDNSNLIQNDLFAFCQEQKITVLHITPSIAEILLVHSEQYAGKLEILRYIFLGGEVLGKELLKRIHFLAPNARIVNYYGATETPQGMAYKEYDLEHLEIYPEKLPIGRGIPDVKILILNGNNQVVKDGMTGEIAVKTPYISKGYLNAEEQDQRRFIQSFEENGTKAFIYKTGDLGRKDEFGNVRILGRKDLQVKIYGHRIELLEIENIISSNKNITSSRVLVVRENLYCFAIVENGYDEKEFFTWIAEKLPDYMIPKKLFVLDQFPVTYNGKIDEKKLLEHMESNLKSEPVHDISDSERSILEVWKEVLQTDKIGVQDRFFEIGGNSMRAVLLQAKLSETLKQEIDIVSIFKYPTIERFAEYIKYQGKPVKTGRTSKRGEAVKNALELKSNQRKRGSKEWRMQSR